MSEIVRAGIISVDEGQTRCGAGARDDAAADDAPRRPAPGDAGDHPADRQRDDLDAEERRSLVYVIAVIELLYTVQLIYSVNYKTIPLLIVACIWYLAATSVLSIGQYYLERLLRARQARSAVGDADRADVSGASPARHAEVATRTQSHRGSRRTSDERADGEGRERAQAVRPARGAEGHLARGRPEARSSA